MRIQTVLDVFQERVPKTFAFLADRHGFAIHRNDDYAFVAKSPDCDVVIELVLTGALHFFIYDARVIVD